MHSETIVDDVQYRVIERLAGLREQPSAEEHGDRLSGGHNLLPAGAPPLRAPRLLAAPQDAHQGGVRQGQGEARPPQRPQNGTGRSHLNASWPSKIEG